MNAIPASASSVNRILIVDDDAGIRTLVSSFLEKHGYPVDTAADPIEMRHRLARGSYALIVLDVMMPGEDGLTALRKLQANDSPPVIMLSAVGSDIDRIVGLEIGAQDYLAKPCNPRELLARIRTVLRRPAVSIESGRCVSGVPDRDTQASFAGWRLDFISRELRNPLGALVQLSDGEFRLLRAFLQHSKRVLTRDQLLELVGSANNECFDRAIDVQVSRLRRKLVWGLERTDVIRTVRSEGYMFVSEVTATPGSAMNDVETQFSSAWR